MTGRALVVVVVDARDGAGRTRGTVVADVRAAVPMCVVEVMSVV